MRRLHIALCFLLLGCATPVQHDTASGRVETVFAKSLEATHAAVLNGLVNRHYAITRDSANLIVADRPSTNGTANVLFGTGFNPIVNARLTFTMISPQPDQTRVVVDMAMVQNPGSGFERLTPGNNSQDSTDIQTWLNSLAAAGV